MKKGTPKLIDWMICDDVRVEDNGKTIIIGIYHDNIIVPGLPFVMPNLVTWTKWDITKGLIKKFEFTISSPDGKVMGHVRGEPSAKAFGKKAILQIAISPFAIKEAGEYRIDAKINETDVLIGSFEVQLRPSARMS